MKFCDRTYMYLHQSEIYWDELRSVERQKAKGAAISRAFAIPEKVS